MRSAMASTARPSGPVKKSHGPGFTGTGGLPAFGVQGRPSAMTAAWVDKPPSRNSAVLANKSRRLNAWTNPICRLVYLSSTRSCSRLNCCGGVGTLRGIAPHEGLNSSTSGYVRSCGFGAGNTYASPIGGKIETPLARLARGLAPFSAPARTSTIIASARPLVAACRGVVWHGRAADLLARSHGQVAIETSEILEQLGPALTS